MYTIWCIPLHSFWTTKEEMKSQRTVCEPPVAGGAQGKKATNKDQVTSVLYLPGRALQSATTP